MKYIITLLLCGLPFWGLSQKRACIFYIDLKANAARLKPADLHIHVREVVDRAQFTDSSGHFDRERFEKAVAGKLDTNIAANADFAFRLRDLNTGRNYSVSIIYYVVPEGMDYRFRRFRATYQEFKVNSWSYEYRIPVITSCRYDASLNTRICPKCHRSDRVLPEDYSGWGFPVEDPLTPAVYPAIKTHQSLQEQTDCSPNWYCERDKLSF